MSTIRARYTRTINRIKSYLKELSTIAPTLEADLEFREDYIGCSHHGTTRRTNPQHRGPTNEQLHSNTNGPDEVVEQARKMLRSIQDRKQIASALSEAATSYSSPSRASIEPRTDRRQIHSDDGSFQLTPSHINYLTPTIALPKIALPTFSGEAFDYLVASLTGQAAQCVQASIRVPKYRRLQLKRTNVYFNETEKWIVPRFECIPSKDFTTRLIDLRTVSIQRCPGLGSCTKNTCSAFTEETKLIEFTAYNEFPGITR
uniref:Phlebovirus_G2 domain-containing protein n=1 Tax=Heterorhabditis bacteriophora TaxID=37862 RepID=A0A1I7XA22_HETBA